MAYVETTTNLNNGVTFTGPRKESERFDRIAGTAFASHTGTVHIEQSMDGTNWDVDDTVSVSASTATKFSFEIVAAFWRLRYVNGGTTTTTLRVSAKTTAASDS